MNGDAMTTTPTGPTVPVTPDDQHLWDLQSRLDRIEGRANGFQEQLNHHRQMIDAHDAALAELRDGLDAWAGRIQRLERTTPPGPSPIVTDVMGRTVFQKAALAFEAWRRRDDAALDGYMHEIGVVMTYRDPNREPAVAEGLVPRSELSHHIEHMTVTVDEMSWYLGEITNHAGMKQRVSGPTWGAFVAKANQEAERWSAAFHAPVAGEE